LQTESPSPILPAMTERATQVRRAPPRPLVLRLLPDRLRNSVAARFYRQQATRWLPLYERASLRFAPACTMELVPGDLVSDSIAFTGFHELGLSRHIVRTARRGGLLVDVGANLGYFSILWTSALPDNRCAAVEASPRNLGLLRRNLEHNGLTDRVVVHPVAAGKTPGALAFDLGPADQTGWGGLALAASPRTVEVEVARIDDLVGGDERVALLKIDVEGADTWVLEGCGRLLRQRQVEEVWYEQNKPRMSAIGVGEGEATEFLQSVGYEAHPVTDPHGMVVEWRAVPIA
jgi:FkbM family methyltransferase